MLAEIAHKIGFDWHLALSHTFNFLLIFFLLVKFVLPKLKATIDERNKKITEGLEKFAKSQKLLEEAESEKAAIISETQKEKKEIIMQAEQQKKTVLVNADIEAKQIVSDSKIEGEKIKKDSFEKGSVELEDKIGSILQTISNKAFNGKVSPEINNEFVKQVFSNSYGK